MLRLSRVMAWIWRPVAVLCVIGGTLPAAEARAGEPSVELL